MTFSLEQLRVACQVKILCRISYQLGQDGTSQGLQEAPELADAAVQRGGMEAYDPREQVREDDDEREWLLRRRVGIIEKWRYASQTTH